MCEQLRQLHSSSSILIWSAHVVYGAYISYNSRAESALSFHSSDRTTVNCACNPVFLEVPDDVSTWSGTFYYLEQISSFDWVCICL
ncbi:hypothetical protein A2U01_0009097 [Trifolium medium]|uniref:Uncharacterized protein n=1 Tax=Trifolium medium TaxID=97028 RepID=A0A392MPL9_9FABA|nr:hypothetical protein [Trifolium medium]